MKFVIFGFQLKAAHAITRALIYVMIWNWATRRSVCVMLCVYALYGLSFMFYGILLFITIFAVVVLWTSVILNKL